MTELEAYKLAYLKLKEGMTIFADRMYTQGHREREIKRCIKESNEVLAQIASAPVKNEPVKKVTKKKAKKKVSKKSEA